MTETETAYDDDTDAGTEDMSAEDTTSNKDEKEEPINLLVYQAGRYKSLKVRALSTVAMIGGFVFIVYLGHIPLMLMIFLIQATMVRELFKLAHEAAVQQKKDAPKMGAMKWYFFGVAAFWMYFRFVKNNLLVEITSSAQLAHLFSWALRRQTLLAYTLYVAGFVAFVLKLEKGKYLHQFTQYAWVHMILLVIFIPSSFFVSNIFDGLIWFLLPCSLVIINDIAAYLSGFFFGRTPLIRLSPKKTWEGFIGGFVLTMLASWYLSRFMSRFKWMVCPRTDLSVSWLDCEPEDPFVPRTFHVHDLIIAFPTPTIAYLRRLFLQLPHDSQLLLQPLIDREFTALPMQLHALVLATFASLIAPFGGFFASGFKRGFKIKDFGDSIPGHGGMTDRMDCQIVMAVFSYIYFNNYVYKDAAAVGAVLSQLLTLRRVDQADIFAKLGNLLAGDGLLPESLVSEFTQWQAMRPRAVPTLSLMQEAGLA